MKLTDAEILKRDVERLMRGGLPRHLAERHAPEMPSVDRYIEHLSKLSRIKEEDDFMEHDEFTIGLEFWLSGKKYRCTDVGTRTVAAIRIDDQKEGDPDGWLVGPPYAVVEHLFDENDLDCASLEPDEGLHSTPRRSWWRRLIEFFRGV